MATPAKRIPVVAGSDANSAPARLTQSAVKTAPQARTMSVSEAKTHLLSVLNNLQTQQEPITITRRGRPIAQIIPFNSPERASGFGAMKGTVTITGDIVSPDHEAWGASS